MVDAPSQGSLNRWFDGQAGAEVGAHTALTASGRRASPGLRMDGGPAKAGQGRSRGGPLGREPREAQEDQREPQRTSVSSIMQF